MMMTRDENFSRSRSLGYVTARIGRLFGRALERAIAPTGVPVGQFAVLLSLWEEDGLTQSEIARRLDFEQPTIANTLKRMQRDGLIVMVPDPFNRRKILARLTRRAVELRGPLIALASRINDQVVAQLSHEDINRLYLSLQLVGNELQSIISGNPRDLGSSSADE